MLLRSRSRRVPPQTDPVAQATDACNQGRDPPYFSLKYINSYVGSGVFCNRQFHAGDFLLEYRGELITMEEGVEREKSNLTRKGNFLYFFDYGNTRKCVDATKADGFARMVNDGVKRANCKMRVVVVEEKLRLCLFASKDLRKGEELFFDYGVKDLPWRQEGWEGDSDDEEKVRKRQRKLSMRAEGSTPKEFIESEVDSDNSEDEYTPDSCEEDIDDDAGDADDDIWDPGQSPKKDLPKEIKCGHQINYEDDCSQMKSSRYRRPARKCPFCFKIYHEKLSRHIKLVHKDIEMVAAALKLPRKARDAAFSLMKKEGIRISNTEEMKSTTPTFQRERNTVTNDSLVMCNSCKGFYSKRFFSRHKRLCQETNLLNSWSMPTSYPTCEPKRKRPGSKVTKVVSSKKGAKKEKNFVLSWQVNAEEKHSRAGSAIYRKPLRKCPFCLNFYNEKLSLHIRTVHKDIDMVAAALKLPRKARDAAFSLMKKEGICISNTEEMKSATPTFQREKYSATNGSLVMCNSCKGFYSKRQLYKHRRKCQGKNLLNSWSIPKSYPTCEPRDKRRRTKVPPGYQDANDKETLQLSETVFKDDEAKYQSPMRKCPFCLKFYRAKLSLHIKKVHKDNERVAEAMRLPKKARDAAFQLMKKEGILINNKEEMKSVTPRFQRERKGKSKGTLVMCGTCKGFYSKKFIHRHRDVCQGSSCLKPSLAPASSSETEPQDKRESKDFPCNLGGNNMAEIYQVLEKESEIFDESNKGLYKKPTRKCPFCLKLFHAKLSRHIGLVHKDIEKVSEALKLPKKARCKAFDLMKKEGILIANRTQMLSATPTLQRERRTKSKDSLVMCEGCKGFYSNIFFKRHRDICPSNSCMSPFSKQTSSSTSEQTTSKKCRSKRKKSGMEMSERRNSPKIQKVGKTEGKHTRSDLAFDDDINKLRRYTVAELSSMLNGDTGVWDHSKFARLRDLTVCRLTLLNFWRGGEPCCMLLEDWQQVDSHLGGDEEPSTSFEDPLGKQLPSSFKVKYQTCKEKSNHQHPILCPSECISAMEILMQKETRSAADILVNNHYIFALGEDSTDHVSGWYALNRLCSDVGVEGYLTAIMNRRHISVLYTTMEATDGGERPFFEIEGHSKENSSSINQVPVSVTEDESVGEDLSQTGGTRRQRQEPLPEDEGPLNETSRYEPVPRRYTKWNSGDEALVKKHFQDVITGCGSKRNPGKRDINFFLKHYKLSMPLSWMTVKSKVVNERVKWHRTMKVQQRD